MFPFTKRTIDRIENVMNTQDDFGIKKYGKPLDPLDDYDWLDMAEEELADALKYFNAEREKRNAVLRSALLELDRLRFSLEEGQYLNADHAAISVINKLQSLLKKR